MLQRFCSLSLFVTGGLCAVFVSLGLAELCIAQSQGPEIISGRAVVMTYATGNTTTSIAAASQSVANSTESDTQLAVQQLCEGLSSGPCSARSLFKITSSPTTGASNLSVSGTPVLGDSAVKATSFFRLDFPINSPEETLQFITQIKKTGLYANVEPDYVVTTSTSNDPYAPPSSGAWGQGFANQWPLEKLSIEGAWARTMGEGVIVAVLDTGIDYNHPDLEGQVLLGPDLVNYDEDPLDDNGHGTHVAGTIAALRGNGEGIVGVAPLAKILAVKVMDSEGFGSLGSIADGIVQAVDRGAGVINLSLGISDMPRWMAPDYMTAALEYARGRSTVIIAAAGNENEPAEFSYPANDPRVIAVAASDHEDRKAFFSNYGPEISVTAPGGGGNTPPDVIYPYSSILSLLSSVHDIPADLIVGGRYARLAGTSMAAPHVAGVAALIKAAHPDFTPGQVKMAIEAGADDVGTPGRDRESGAGRINAERAVAFDSPLEVSITRRLPPVVNETTVSVFGTVGGVGLVRWFLEYQLDGGQQWVEIAYGTNAVQDELISEWQLAAIPDGNVELRLRAANAEGVEMEDRTFTMLDRIALSSPPEKTLTDFMFDPLILRGEDFSIHGQANPGNFLRYEIVLHRYSNKPGDVYNYASLVRLANDGRSPVPAGGVLGHVNTSQLPDGAYELHLTVYLVGGSVVRGIGNLVVDKTLRLGFPLSIPGAGMLNEHLTAADVNEDGSKEILIAFGSTVRAVDGNGQIVREWNISERESSGLLTGSPVIADVDYDGVLELVASTMSGDIFAWELSNGSLVPGYPIHGPAFELAATDLDDDGRQEIIGTASHLDSGPLTVFEAAPGGSRKKWSRQADGCSELQSGFRSKVAVADTDGDGNKEIAALGRDSCSGEWSAYLFESDGRVRAGFPVAFSGNSTSSSSPGPVFADLDGDGTLEIIFSTTSGMVHAYHADGRVVAGWPVQPQQLRARSPVVGDINGDGLLEVVVAYDGAPGVSGKLFALSGSGTVLPGFPITPEASGVGSRYPVRSLGTPVLADVDGNGVADIVLLVSIRHISYSFQAFQGTGAQVPGFSRLTLLSTSAADDSSPAIGDFDGDGFLEVALLDARPQLLMWDLAVPTSVAQPWPMYRQDVGQRGAHPPYQFPRPEDEYAVAVGLDDQPYRVLLNSVPGQPNRWQPLSPKSVRKVVVGNSGVVYAIGAEDSRVYKSRLLPTLLTRGWSAVGNGQVKDLEIDDDEWLYAIGLDDRVYRQSGAALPGVASWARLNQGQVRQIAPGHSEEILALGLDNEVWSRPSSLGAFPWQHIGPVGPKLLDVAGGDEQFVYGLGLDNRPYRTLRAAAGVGSGWQQVSPAKVLSFTLTPSRFVAVGLDSQLWSQPRSTRVGGWAWTLVAPGAIKSMSAIPSGGVEPQ